MQEYPSHLLPCSNYRKIGQDLLLSLSNLLLVRHVDSTEVRYIGDSDILHPDCISFPSSRLDDLSCNLLGVFRKEDVYFGINKEFYDKYITPWEEGTEVEQPSGEEYFIDEMRDCYFIDVEKLVNLSFPANSDTKYHFVILHTPNKCNFWHISVRISDNDCEINNIPKTTLSDKQKKRIRKSAKDILLADAVTTKAEYFTLIPNHHYKLTNDTPRENAK